MTILQQSEAFVRKCDQILAELFRSPHRFNSTNVRAKLQKVGNQCRSALRLFDGRFSDRLSRAYVCNFKLDISLLNDIEELLTGFTWSELHTDPIAFKRFEILLAKNGGRDLAPLQIETILQA